MNRTSSRLIVCITLIAAVVFLGGCAQFPRNDPLDAWQEDDGYNFAGWDGAEGEIMVAVSLSGGGARAAAFAFGALEAMQLATTGPSGDSFLREVDIVSSVSGGSVTAAYWAAYGHDRLFRGFGEDFLERDVQGDLTKRLFWPPTWFRLMGEEFERVDLVAEYLDEHVFRGTTFGSLAMTSESGPFFLINATDSSWGTRFDFTQDTFSQMCSDLDSYPLSRAVTASGAVPVASSPITLQNYGWEACGFERPAWLAGELEQSGSREKLRKARAITSYSQVADGAPVRRWTHLVDGGVADNLGIEGLLDVAFSLDDCSVVAAPRHLVVIVVDAMTELDHCTDYEIAGPGLGQAVSAAANITIDRLSDKNADRLHSHLNDWAERCTVGPPPDVHTIFVRIPPVRNRAVHDLLQVDTSLSLPCESVDALRCAGRNVFEIESESLVNRLGGTFTAADGVITSESSCSPAGRDRSRRPLDCGTVQPTSDLVALNKDTPARCNAR